MDTVQIYDISADQWSARPELPKGMYWATSEAVGGKIYLIGEHSKGGSLSSLYILDTATLT